MSFFLSRLNLGFFLICGSFNKIDFFSQSFIVIILSYIINEITLSSLFEHWKFDNCWYIGNELFLLERTVQLMLGRKYHEWKRTKIIMHKKKLSKKTSIIYYCCWECGYIATFSDEFFNRLLSIFAPFPDNEIAIAEIIGVFVGTHTGLETLDRIPFFLNQLEADTHLPTPSQWNVEVFTRVVTKLVS